MTNLTDARDVDRVTLSGLTEGEAMEFNRLFVMSFVIFTVIALIAHILVLIWRPWLQNSVPEQVSSLVHPLLTMLS